MINMRVILRRGVSPLSLACWPVSSVSKSSLSTSASMRDRQRQPTGKAGMPSPYLRTPFFHERAPPPGVDLSLQERLDELYPKNPLRGDRVNIGFAAESSSKSSRGRVSDWRRGARANKELEKAAREGSLDIDLGQVRDSWVQAGAVYEDIMAAADLYGVFEDLFGHAYFRPCLMLDIRYAFKDVLVPVHRGNMVKPREAATAPKVTWKSDNNGLWCLMMTGLDSHLQSETSQYLHWMVANIRGHDLASGDTICDYIQPFPAHGTGYHRYSFVLFKQEALMELQKVDESDREVDLQARSINSAEFYEEHQDNITPAGLGFFQSDYDSSIRDFFHNRLQMKEPKFEYEFPDWYVTPWLFPFAQSAPSHGFDEFLDRRRNPKDLEREVLEEKLRHTDPFTGDTEAYIKYPGVHMQELEEQFPAPPGEKRLNPKQSYKIAQWRRNAVQKQRLKQRYFRSTDHLDLRRDPTMTSR